MGNPLPPTLANIFMGKLEDVVTPQICYAVLWPVRWRLFFQKEDKYYLQSTCHEKLLWNSYPNIKFTVEENPDYFLDTS